MPAGTHAMVGCTADIMTFGAVAPNPRQRHGRGSQQRCSERTIPGIRTPSNRRRCNAPILHLTQHFKPAASASRDLTVQSSHSGHCTRQGLVPARAERRPIHSQDNRDSLGGEGSSPPQTSVLVRLPLRKARLRHKTDKTTTECRRNAPLPVFLDDLPMYSLRTHLWRCALMVVCRSLSGHDSCGCGCCFEVLAHLLGVEGAGGEVVL